MNVYRLIADKLRNTGVIWFCIMICWYLAELVEPGQQYADPVTPSLYCAILASGVYTALREAGRHESSTQVSSKNVQ